MVQSTSHLQAAQILQQAFAAFQSGNLAECERLAQMVLKQQPEHPDTLNLLGLAAAQSGRPLEAADLFTRALRGAPGNPTLHGHLGIVLRNLGRHDEAIQCFDRALALQPNLASAHNNRGSALADIQRHEEAVASFERAIAANAGYAQAWYNLGNSQSALRRLDAAIASYRQAIALDAAFADAHNNLGVALAERNAHEDAIASYRRAIALQPQFAEAYNNLGAALGDLRRYDEAIAAFERSIALDPEYADAHWNLALYRLLLGDFARGWAGYEWRWQQDQVARFKRDYSQPLWRGTESVSGKTMLLYAEQGLGDMLQFCRYASRVAGLGATVVLEAPPALQSVLSGLQGVAQVVAQGNALPAFDIHCPVTSLPLAFNTTADTIPRDVPYLAADAARVALWQTKLGAKTKPRVGLAWSGNVLPDPNRSMTLADALALLTDGVEIISLQKEIRAADAALLAARTDIRHYGDDLKDFADTAALIACVDLVISIDTSVAHLAGALGKPLWVMLPYNPDWRWMVDREDCLWYPSARLFRQTTIGDWREVLQRVRAALHEQQSQKPPSPGAARHPLPKGEGWCPSPSGRGVRGEGGS